MTEFTLQYRLPAQQQDETRCCSGDDAAAASCLRCQAKTWRHTAEAPDSPTGKQSHTTLRSYALLIREFAVELATPLCSIINASLSQHSCPADWKTSYVTPIPKTSSPQSLNDLRPVSITPIPSLICEDFVYDWAYTKICNTVDIRQFGNIKATSTSHYLTSFLEFIHSHLDKRNTSLAVAFVDFKKAFDLVDHTVVISKAVSLGLPPNLIAWLADFLTGRRQAVRYQGSVSNFQQLTCGVPMGTKMGPLCFLLLINDALTDTPHRWKYVDDCTVGVPVSNKNPDYSPLQAILERLQTWTEESRMTINHSKTVVMHFCTSSVPVPPPRLTVGPHPFQVVQCAKLLGVTVDDQLTWKQHVASTVRSATLQAVHAAQTQVAGDADR
ncbi:hypothetical protein O3P69_003745 [Scylla paramamosain]|uniref:Reverse transcriptase domain-containing protein n=1 Tax=Scylla paramamosain TaxID=85552 RepID=A0AAW0UGH5_SCYPA